ncbi:MAG: hypothetical protein ACRBCI_11560 [Cellvibrionaceae bacterium]
MLSVIAFCNVGFAESTRAVGQVTIDIKSKKPSSTEIRSAKNQAAVKALEKFIQADMPKLRLYDQCLRPNILERINEFVNESYVVNESVDKKARQYKVTLRIDINVARLDNALESECKGSGGAKARISFVFFARQKLADGSYKIPDGNKFISTKVRQVFLNNTFKVVSNNRLERADRRYKKKSMETAYLQTGDIDWLVVEEAVLRVGSDYFSFGAFDIRPTTVDKVSGLRRASVVVSAELMDLGDESSLGVAGPVQAVALGATDDEAITNALITASEKLANAIVSQLNAQRKH